MSTDVDPDTVTVTLVRRITRRVTVVEWKAEDPHANELNVKDTVTLWATVSGAAPVRKTRTVAFLPSRLILTYERTNGAPYSAGLRRPAVSGRRILKIGLGVELTQSFWFEDDLPEWLLVFAADNLPRD